MCGICGIIRFDGQPADPTVINVMRTSLLHRGPDDYGQYVAGPVAIANLRLSIIDLQTGRQPIANEDNTAVIVYNGEVYNFQELRSQLTNHVFRTQSDTEVILHAYDEWERACLPRLNGMFALAIWDETRRTLLLARDRIGIKPLYFVHTPHYFAFASEIKALLSAELAQPDVNRAALQTYLAVKYVPTAHTAFEQVQRLQPGEWITVELDGRIERGTYWDFRLTPPAAPRSESDYAEELRGLIQQAVHDQLVADVPVGAFLSGGLDSGIVVSEMAHQMTQRVDAFTIDYDTASPTQNESAFAKLIADHAGVAHRSVSLTAQQARDLLPTLIYHLDEPILEPLLAPSYLLSQAAREEVTVVLTGEGADELFAGYPRYQLSYLIHRLELLPPALRRAAYHQARKWFGPQDVKTRVLNVSLDHSAVSDWYVVFTAREIAALTGSSPLDTGWANQYLESTDSHDLLASFLVLESRSRLPEYLLTRADKMTMANSLEMRPPLLDNRIIDFALKLPAQFKLNGRQGKYIMRRAFKDRIPDAIVNRPKVAFSAPFEKWLPELCKTYLTDSHCAQAGLLNQHEIQRLLHQDPFYRGRHAEKLWSLITLEIWFRIFVDGSLLPPPDDHQYIRTHPVAAQTFLS